MPSSKKLWARGHSKSVISFANFTNSDDELDGDWRNSEACPLTPMMRWPPTEIKRQGETISKGHRNYELMLNLQLGIRYSVYLSLNCLCSTINIEWRLFSIRVNSTNTYIKKGQEE
jgi:hypothetical protein